MSNCDKLTKYIGKTIKNIELDNSLWIEFEDGSVAFFSPHYDGEQIISHDDNEELEVLDELSIKQTKILNTLSNLSH
jgi:hypothetical protein